MEEFALRRGLVGYNKYTWYMRSKQNDFSKSFYISSNDNKAGLPYDFKSCG